MVSHSERPRSRRVRPPWRQLISAAATALVMTASMATAEASGLLVADGGFGGVLEIAEHEVEVTINNGIAVTEVTQVFRNTEDRQLEALYTFPVPRGASISEFSMWIGGKEMVGEVVEKRRAREIYESYKRRNIDPGLLEQVDYKTFEMRIFPVAPNAEQRVRIVYYQELEIDADWATYVYPLATSTRTAIDSRTRGRFAMNLTARSEIPIVEIESPSHTDDFVMVQHAEHQVQASLEATGGDLSRDVVLAFRTERARTGVDLVASKERGEDGYFLLTLTAGDELAKQDEGMDYVFVLDISGSMRDAGKLQVSRGSLDAFIRALGPEDRFEVLAFNVAANPLFQGLRPAERGAIDEAEGFLASQKARGGTVLEPALRRAYGYKDPDRLLNVVILSDGMTEQAERQTLLRLIGERPNSTRVFAIGVGNDVNRPLLQQMAEDAGGLAAFLSRGDDFERKAAAFRRKLLRPAISNLEIVADGGGVFDVEPRTLPSLYHGLPVRMYGRYEKSGPVTLTIRGDIGSEPFEKTIEIQLPKDGVENPEVERMWACHRVRRLLQDGDRAGSRDTVAEEVVRLGEGYSIVTPYTSFLVLENDGEYQRWKIERRNATRVQRDRAARERLREELTALQSAAANELGPMAEGARKNRAPNTPQNAGGSQPANRTSGAPPAPQPSTGRGWDLPLKSNGGGALDPFSVGLVLGLGGLAAAARRRRRDENENERA